MVKWIPPLYAGLLLSTIGLLVFLMQQQPGTELVRQAATSYFNWLYVHLSKLP